MVLVQAMARFTASKGGSFPAPTAVNHLTWAPQEAVAPTHTSSGDAATGVVLLGDSAHCFPPDVAQGLNSGLEDVATFAAALEEAGDDVPAALEVYERRRQPDTQALAQLMQVRVTSGEGPAGTSCCSGMHAHERLQAGLLRRSQLMTCGTLFTISVYHAVRGATTASTVFRNMNGVRAAWTLITTPRSRACVMSWSFWIKQPLPPADLSNAFLYLHLPQIAGPLQYKQYPQLFKLWLLKAAGHLLLSKAFPFWIEPPVFKTIWDYNRSYASIWEGLQRSRAAMRRLGAAALVLVVALVLRGTLGA